MKTTLCICALSLLSPILLPLIACVAFLGLMALAPFALVAAFLVRFGVLKQEDLCL